ncbi:MAG: right-handed parallel beta-helix repeat-containing protein [Chloroflexi bacterium]|nr:right-handed parallel beta-helix repeat-containing protein [Chloroflexota bacterium]
MSTPPGMFSGPIQVAPRGLLLRLATVGVGLAAGIFLSVSFPLPAGAQGPSTYYVRPDGGSTTQCSGQADAPYPGTGTAQPCAWDHPFRALPPAGPPRIAGGDTLIIAAGRYRMGYGAPEADREDSVCARDYPWACVMPPIPSGPDAAHPTRILGSGWDSGCANPPELWGTERAHFVLNLTGSSNIELACLEITDHSGCVEDHTGGLACERNNYPYGDWAAVGLYAADSANVHLQDVNIHGLANTGVHAGRLTDWTLQNVRIAGNGWAGWDGDIAGTDTNSGTLTFRHWTVEWNGCAETYPGEQPAGCWAQTAGGYGDGVGTGATGGNWVIEESRFLHNTSDGLDLLYHTLGGTVTLNRVRAEGNAGNQVKIAGSTTITNSVLVGNCAFFDGQTFTYNVDPCRALGNTLEIVYTGGEHSRIVNSTLYGQGDGLISGGKREGFQCNGTETLTGWNNLFLGDDDYFSPGDITFLFYQETCPGLTLASDYSLAYHVKNTGAPYTIPAFPGTNNLLQDPLLAGPLSGATYGMTLTAGSPAIDAGASVGAPAIDFEGHPRDATPDIGAYEYCALTGDFDGDRQITVSDMLIVAGDWHDPAFDPAHDLDGNGMVDVVDVMQVAARWGQSCN